LLARKVTNNCARSRGLYRSGQLDGSQRLRSWNSPRLATFAAFRTSMASNSDARGGCGGTREIPTISAASSGYHHPKSPEPRSQLGCQHAQIRFCRSSCGAKSESAKPVFFSSSRKPFGAPLISDASENVLGLVEAKSSQDACTALLAHRRLNAAARTAFRNLRDPAIGISPISSPLGGRTFSRFPELAASNKFVDRCVSDDVAHASASSWATTRPARKPSAPALSDRRGIQDGCLPTR